MRFFLSVSLTFSLFLLAPSLQGAIITSPGQTIVFDFANYQGNGISDGTGQNTGVTANGNLDSNDFRVLGFSDGNVEFGGSANTGDFARGISSGGVTSGGLYAFDVGGGVRALGVQPTAADFTPGSFDVQYLNNSGQTLNDFNISYSIYVNNDQARANSFNFAFNVNDSDPAASYTAVPSLDYTSPEAGSGSVSFTKIDRSTTLTGLDVANGQTLYLRFSSDDVSGSGSRDEFAINNITVQAVPEPTSMALLGMVGLGGIIGHRIRKRRLSQAGSLAAS